MEYNSLLVRYGELFLKGNNFSFFERKLIANTKAMTGITPTHRVRGRLILPYFPQHRLLRRVFGLGSYSLALKAEKELFPIKLAALNIMKEKKGTFRVETKRSDKRFPITSPQLNKEIGIFLEKETRLVANFENPDLTLAIEINDAGAFLSLEAISCLGGLPVGVEGKVYLLVEDKASLLAGLLMMKRGCLLQPITLQDELDLSLLQLFSPELLKIKKVQNLRNVNSMLVFGDQLGCLKARNEAGFYPLIAYAEEEVSQQWSMFQQILNTVLLLPLGNWP